MLKVRIRISRIYFFGFIFAITTLGLAIGAVNKPQLVSAQGASPSCSITAWRNGSNPLSWGFRMNINATAAQLASVLPGHPGVNSPWTPYLTSPGANYFNTYTTPGSKTVIGRFNYARQGSPARIEVQCSRTIVVSAPPSSPRGCTNPLATNYNPAARIDDGSCVFPPRGCTNPLATNYNPAARIDDGSCVFITPRPGCTNPAAINYNPSATSDDGSCLFAPVIPLIECPSYPPFALNFNNPSVVVAMPDQGKPDNVYSDAVPGAESSSSADAGISGNSLSQTESRIITYVQQGSRDAFYAVYITNQGVDKTRVVSVLDKLWAGETTDYNVGTSGDGTIELDYTSHSVNYPYDTHQPMVTFQVQYENRQLIQDGSRTRTIIETRTQSRAVDTDPWGAWSNWGVASDTGYGAWGSWGNRPNNMQRLGYAWTTNFTADGVVMPPCWPRDFTATAVANNASLVPDQEDPTDSNFNFEIRVVFNVSHGGSLRTASLVKDLEYTVEYTGRGYTGGSISGTETDSVTINAAGTNVPSNGSFSGSRTVSATVPTNLNAGDKVCWTIRVDKPKGTVKVSSGDIIESSGPASFQEACSQYAVDIPYTRFYGADVYAGGGFAVPGETCSAAAVADATGRMKGSSVVDFRGTGAQLALFAVGQITGVQAIAQQTGRDPTQLSFANTVTNSALREFGGGFGSAICANDYFADVPNTSLPDLNVDVGTLASGRYYYNAGGPINFSGLVPDGRRIVIYVDGDAVINGGHFGYANNSSWPTSDDIPSLYIIARGNVYIDDAVSVLDGVYIAQPEDDGTEGEIYTCTLNDGVNNLDLTVNNSYSIKALTIPCRTQLRVYGAFIAKRVNLLRTLGSLRESVVSEGPDPSRSAEIFQYSPEMYLTGGGGLPSTTRIQIDSYVSLPPSL